MERNETKIIGTSHSVFAMPSIITEGAIEDRRLSLLEENEKLKQIIIDLVEKVRLLREKFGEEYPGGKPFCFIIEQIRELGIKVEV